MGDNPHLVLMYGTLKSTEPNHQYLYTDGVNGATFAGMAKTVSAFPLVVTTKFNLPFLLLQEGTGHRVTGELYRLTDATLKFTDEFEGHPQWYTRTRCSVEMLGVEKDKGVVECWVYGLNKFPLSYLELPMYDVYHNVQPGHDKFLPLSEDDFNTLMASMAE